jgi:GTP-binding protein
MEKQLRSDAGFSGTPIRLLWRSRRKMEKDEGQYDPCFIKKEIWMIFSC